MKELFKRFSVSKIDFQATIQFFYEWYDISVQSALNLNVIDMKVYFVKKSCCTEQIITVNVASMEVDMGTGNHFQFFCKSKILMKLSRNL